MVNALAHKRELAKEGRVRELLSTRVRATEVFRSGLRLEAGAYGIEARRAFHEVLTGGLRAIPLYGQGGLCSEAHNAFRFRRIYVMHDYGVPFLSSADIIRLDEPADVYLSKKLTKNLDRLLVRKWDVLISCSGTIGNVALAGDVLAGKALSQDAIRLRHADENVAGFIVAFLRSRYGRPQVSGASYGSVISHIEPEHLQGIIIPEPTPLLQTQIGRPMVEATRKRDEANRLISQARQKLIKKLDLPDIETLREQNRRRRGIIVKSSRLHDRLEASFHTLGRRGGYERNPPDYKVQKARVCPVWRHTHAQ
jgi:type I restriction enzyme, S subunit